MQIEIDQTKCIQCGNCAKVCRPQIIQKENQKFIITNTQNCKQCGQCVAVCPTTSIKFKGQQQPPTPQTVAEKVIILRRSCRKFKQQEIPQEQLKSLINLTQFCATACGARPLHYRVINLLKNKQYEKYVVENSEKLIGVKYSPQNAEPLFRTAPQMIICYIKTDEKCVMYPATEDNGIALAVIELAAYQRELGSFYCGQLQSALQDAECKKLYNFSENEQVLGCVGVGIPEVNYINSIFRDDVNMSIE